MAVTAKMYGQMLLKALNKEINWTADTIKVALLSSAYTPDQDTHDYWNDVSTHQVTGTGYTAGGEELVSKSEAYDAPTNRITLDGDNVSWANSTITARYAVVYDDTPATAAEKPLLGYVDFGQDESSSNGTFEIQWNASGIFEITIT